MLEQALGHLAALVGHDTRNPPRDIRPDVGLFAYLREQLDQSGFRLETVEHGHGDGCVSLLALRGQPRLLLNFHVDTVPDAGGFSADPLRLRLADGRATGLGACDVKGAAACALTAAAHTGGDAALLFTSDEEAGAGRCVKAFLAGSGPRHPPLSGVVVAEPTRGRAVLGHRGIASAVGTFLGSAGHASSPRALVDSAVHEAVRWASAALGWAGGEETREVGGLSGIRFNLGVIQGGKKSNMIADCAEVRFGIRPRPGEDPLEALAQVQRCAPDPGRVRWQTTFIGPPLPGKGQDQDAAALAASLGLPVGPPVDFWSEAALFSAAGYPALVYGPGDIAQAHGADEWITVAALQEGIDTYLRIFSMNGASFHCALPSRS